MLDSKLIEAEYGFLGDRIFLNIASVAMPPRRVQQAYGGFMDSYVQNLGADVVPRAWEIVGAARPKLARLIGCAPHEIGFVKNTCEGMSILANGFPFRPGDNVVISDQEHSSNLFPWINMHRRTGLELKIIPSVAGEIPLGAMVDAMDSRTKILAISSGQFSTGFFADLETLGAACARRGVILAVDGIQSLGRMDINAARMGIGYLAAGTNKGLLGTLGAGFVYCSDTLVQRITPPYASYQSVVSHAEPPAVTLDFERLEWHPDARRFESGNLSYNCILALSLGVDLILELGISEIEAHIRRLEADLRQRLAGLPLEVVQPKNPANWGGIVCVYYPAGHEGRVADILARYRIYATLRAGYIRFGLGFYNTHSHMAAVARAMEEIAALS